MKEELAIRAAELFGEISEFCDIFKTTSYSGSGVELYQCKNCGKQMFTKDGFVDYVCKKFTPIDISDWNVAMKLRDEMRNSRIWNDACYEIWQSFTGKAVTQEVFWRDYAIPKHYIEAAWVAKERKTD